MGHRGRANWAECFRRGVIRQRGKSGRFAQRPDVAPVSIIASSVLGKLEPQNSQPDSRFQGVAEPACRCDLDELTTLIPGRCNFVGRGSDKITPRLAARRGPK